MSFTRGDMFDLRTGLELAKANYQRAKGKRGLEGVALLSLGEGHMSVANRSTNPKQLDVAKNAVEAALRRIPKASPLENWVSAHVKYGEIVWKIAERDKDVPLLQSAVWKLEAAKPIALQVGGIYFSQLLAKGINLLKQMGKTLKSF